MIRTFLSAASAALLSAIFATAVFAQTQNDFDGDGISDLTYLSTSGSLFLWKAIGSHSGTEQLNIAFGTNTGSPALAHWLTPDMPTLGVVQLDVTQKHILWKIFNGGAVQESGLGNSTDLAVSGGDFDGDGIADAAVVRIVGTQLRWYVIRNIFSAAPSKVKVYRVGVGGDRAFFMNYDGTADWIGAFGLAGRKKARILLKNITTGKSKIIRGFPAALARGDRPRPFPIKQVDGTDLIGFATSDGTDTTVSVYNTAARKVAQVTLSGVGTIFVGDYLPDEPGEEIAFQSGTTITYFNPVSSVRTQIPAVNGTPVCEINFKQFATPTPVPTATPTETPTDTPSS